MPVVTVLFSGRPVAANDLINRSDAFVAAWLPGTEGLGLTDLLVAGRGPRRVYDFTGKLPFEIQKVRALPNGFELRFTQAVDAEVAGNPDNYDVTQYTYLYHGRYGSPEMDHDGNENSSTTIAIRSASVSADKKTVTLILEGWREGYVTVVRCLDMQNEEGKPLRNDTFHYTLNQIPK